MVFGTKHEHVLVKLGKDKIWESSNVKLLGVEIDNELKFYEHISNICQKGNRNLSSLTRLSTFTFQQNDVSFTSKLSQNHNLSIVHWYGCFTEDRQTIQLTGFMKVLLEQCIMTMCHLFQDLLNKDSSFTIHHQNIQSLATKIHKILNNLSGGTFQGLFTLNTDSYSLCSDQELIFSNASENLKVKN